MREGTEALKVLIVEDEELIAERMALEVARLFPGAVVDTVRTGTEADKRLDEAAYDVCLLDLFLEEGSGLNVLVKRRTSVNATAFIVVTGSSRKDLAAEAMANGACDYLVKGQFDDFELEKSIRYSVYRKQREAEILALANRDALTGLANRASFADRLGHALERTRRSGGSVAVLYIDLDGFKPINDEHGHAAGDKLLRTVARRLVEAVRRSDTCARLGGDEFAVILDSPVSREVALRVAGEVHTRLIQPYDIDGLSVRIGASVGVAGSDQRAASADQLVALADERMYKAKKAGGGVVSG